METLGSRRMARPITMALSPSYKMLASATAAGGEGDDGSARGSRVDILRLWRDEKDPEKGRRLEILTSIPDCDGDLHRLAWSRPVDNNWKYPLGLLAGGLGSGGVCIWNPARLSYEPGLRTIDADVDRSFPLVCAGGIICDSSKMSYVSYNDWTKTELAKPKFDKKVEEAVLNMSREVETLYMNQAEDCEQAEDWELVSKDQIEDVCKDTLLSHKARGFVLRMSGFTGPVRGLAFNNQYSNMLAASAQGDKLNIYYIDCPVKESTSTYEFVDTSEKVKNAQTTFLEWHPQYPAILASTCDRGSTTIWDIRKKIPATIGIHGDEYLSEVHWQPNSVLCLATASNGNQSSGPVKIWDLKCSIKATHTFGPKKGVNSLSWSPADDLILATDTAGGVTCWKLNDKSADLCGAHTTASSSEVRWCESEGAFVVYSTDGVGLYKLLNC